MLNIFAFVLLAVIGVFMVYEIIGLVQKIVERRKSRKAKSNKEVDDNDGNTHTDN